MTSQVPANLIISAMKLKPLVFIFILGFFCYQCSSFREVSNMRHCEFRYEGADNFSLAGVDLNGVRSFQDLGMLNASRILASAGKGTLPARFVVHVGARNPNSSLAAVNRIDYMVLIDDKEVLQGSLDQRIEVPANSTTSIPVGIQTDLMHNLSQQSSLAIINLLLNLAGEGKTSSRIVLKLKPSIAVGKGYLKYPAYITLTREFSSH